MWQGTQRVRKNPQMSLALLAEYMVASFVRKKSILQEAKYPKDFIVPQYEPAQRAVARYLAGGGGDHDQLAKQIDSMLVGSPRTTLVSCEGKTLSTSCLVPVGH